MKIVFITTEAVPFAKTGGLADVCGSLPIELANLGHEVSVLMPAFHQIRDAGQAIVDTNIALRVAMNGQDISARLAKSKLPNSEVAVYFINQPQLFDRPQLYGDQHGDYRDNALRFAFFSRACLQAIDRLHGTVDVVHCNDWQAGLVPAHMATGLEPYAWMRTAASVLTIHNLAYQGTFPKTDLPLTGFDWDYFHARALEFYDQLNYLKTGIVFADAVTTVSARYAEEIQTPQHGCGLDGVLRDRAGDLFGIPNGIDNTIWNPTSDKHLVQNFSAETWQEGKAANRAALQAAFGLRQDPDMPLIGLVGRLAEQKGWDLVIAAMRHFLEAGSTVQWVVLGTGDPRYHEALSNLAERHRDHLGLHLGFSDKLAHRIEAGADIFLMPSRYEPCGLNQLYSLKYGTVPVVNPTGGLADTVVDATPENVAAGTATGFYLPTYDPAGLIDALSKALTLRAETPEKWVQIAQSGMSQDWSWGRSAARYEAVYEQTLARKRAVSTH